ncbi:Dolichyl-phosphate-mannose--protein mannosyltransferase 1 [Mycoemilia scoparia]|uniref:Dolichyl-phosphate-mannose--protein mannosyltransferase n=1 Tax=Mycoemilia scoparia TaxID=417184 RepID=A0A9W8A5Q9_9FUNG|nr:Dolichyl-phosphate-mannose--protein mannosyltransferase 1 [Mycoemilia scoparia]
MTVPESCTTTQSHSGLRSLCNRFKSTDKGSFGIHNKSQLGKAGLNRVKLRNRISPRFQGYSTEKWIYGLCILSITLVSIIVRCWRLDIPNVVVFDEVHVGGYIGKYIKGLYFTDLNPPLGKMLYTLASKLARYDGQFNFDNVGRRHDATAPTFGWYSWLLATGMFVGCSISTGFTGFLVMLAINLSACKELWDMVTDNRVSVRKWRAHIATRVVALVIIPASIYLATIAINFSILTHAESHRIMTPEFYSTLKGAREINTMRDIFYGSEVRIRYSGNNYGYLHSHHYFWNHPQSSKQQQITIYDIPEPNNIWVIEKASMYIENGVVRQRVGFNNTYILHDEPMPVLDEDIVRLRHKNTGAYLHSHNHPAPVATMSHATELTGYGGINLPEDPHDLFTIEAINDSPINLGEERKKKSLKAIETKFRLRHVVTGCHVFNSQKALPKWGFGQTAPICMFNPKPKKSTWYIEEATHPREHTERIGYQKPGLWRRFVEYNKNMVNLHMENIGNHRFASRPAAWPLLKGGIGYWGKKGHVVYLLGNPTLWWGSAASILFGTSMLFLTKLLKSRRISLLGGQEKRVTGSLGFFILLWTVNFLPLFLIKRELFIHYYIPALWVGIMAMTATLDFFTANIGRAKRVALYIAFAAYSIHAFYVFTPFTYGTTLTKKQCESASWLKSWKLPCDMAVDYVPEVKETAQLVLPEATLQTFFFAVF